MRANGDPNPCDGSPAADAGWAAKPTAIAETSRGHARCTKRVFMKEAPVGKFARQIRANEVIWFNSSQPGNNAVDKLLELQDSALVSTTAEALEGIAFTGYSPCRVLHDWNERDRRPKLTRDARVGRVDHVDPTIPIA